MSVSLHLRENQYIIPSYQLYNGVSGLQCYGVLGSRLKNNVIQMWKKMMIENDDVEEIETPIMMPHVLLKASGHVDQFDDLMIEGENIRADHFAKQWFEEHDMNSDVVDTYNQQELEEVMKHYQMLPNVKVIRKNLMYKVDDLYLRPEIAQAMFVNFKEVYQFLNKSLPFGIAQVGKSFRKEISPEPMIRLREFTQGEIEYFVDPLNKHHPKYNHYKNTVIPLFTSHQQLTNGEMVEMSIEKAIKEGILDNTVMATFLAKIYLFAQAIGLTKIRFRQHLPNEMAHYASACWDLESFVNHKWLEVIGCADRGSFDLEAHAKASGHDLRCKRSIDPIIINQSIMIPNKKAIALKYHDLTQQIVDQMVLTNTSSMIIDDVIYVMDESMYTIKNKTKTIEYEEFYPHVIEPSFGIDRLIYSILEQNFSIRNGTRKVLSLNTQLAPYTVAVFPLIVNQEFIQMAERINSLLTMKYYYDKSSTTIGKKYVRSDEMGIKYAITIDKQTFIDQTVTLRDRDSMTQIRIHMNDIISNLI